MSEENKRTVRSTLTRKFGVSEKKDERRPRNNRRPRRPVAKN